MGTHFKSCIWPFAGLALLASGCMSSFGDHTFDPGPDGGLDGSDPGGESDDPALATADVIPAGHDRDADRCQLPEARKLFGGLAYALDATGAAKSAEVLEPIAEQFSIPFEDDRFLVDIRLADEAAVAISGQEMRIDKVSVSVINDVANHVLGWVAVDDLLGLAASSSVASVSPPRTPVAEEETSEGVELMGADVFHEYALTGAGVRVAVLDMGFEEYGDRRDEGEVPPPAATVSYRPDGDIYEGSDTQHGTGVAEIVHDVSPDAELVLATFQDVTGFVQAMEWAANDVAADVIVTSIGSNITEPLDGSGLLARTASEIADEGTLFLAAAGNSGNKHYRAPFSGIQLGNSVYHDFGGGSNVAAINVSDGDGFPESLPGGSVIDVRLVWDDWGPDPDNPSSTQDYDLWLVYSPDLVNWYGYEASENYQDGNGQPPVERIAVQTPGPAYWGVVAVEYDTTRDCTFQIFSSYQNMSASIRTPGYSLVSPCVGEQVLCIGATDLDDEVEIYSSLGPSIPPTGYDKPELFAPDCVTNATYAPSRFCGTSAAAPHAAGAAALYLQALDFDPTAVREVMLEETVPVGPGGQYGRVQASCTVGGLPDICETDPNAEICDGLDNDGDSARDEGLVDCAAPAASDPIGFFAETADLGEHVAYIDDVGDLHLLYYRWTDAGWRHFHVSDRFGLPPVEGEVHGWGSQETPWGDFLHLVFRDTSGDVHEVWYDVSNATTPPSYGWNHHVLTQMTGAPLATSDPIGNFAVTSQEKGEHVFYVDAAGHVIELYFMYDFGAWQGAPGAATWTWRDLTDDVHDCADGCPTASGGLDSWFTALPETYGYFQHVVYRDSDDHVHELYNCWWNENPFWDDWADHDLGAETGAPVATSDPSGYYSATDGLEAEHIMYTDANGEVVELYYVYAEQEWNWHSLSDLIGAPTAVTAPDGWYSPTGGDEWEHGIYTDLDGHVRELFYMFGSEDGWSQQSLTVESNCPPAIGKPSGYYSAVTDDQGEEKTEHVVFRAADGQVYEMYFLYADPGAGWHCHSLNPPTEY